MIKTAGLIREEKGSAMVFVSIIIGIVALALIAIVVDVGMLYVERKEMITSADAAAIAGAQVLRESNGVNVSEAKLTAEKYAKANGADADQINVYVGKKTVTLPNGKNENRQIIEVNVGKKEQAFFAGFLGDDYSNVKASAVATWGYIYKSYIWDFIPLFFFDTEYKKNETIFLHEKVENSNSYGYIDIGGGMNSIKAAIAGESVGGTYIEENLLSGRPGQGSSLILGVEERMRTAQGKVTADERRKTMIGLIPVINREAFLSVPENLGKNAAKYELSIKYFAYFEIIDVIKKNGFYGSSEALDPNNEYIKVSSAINYSSQLNGKEADYTYIIGQFTGKIVEARTIIEIGDQINPNPDGELPATYSKLIK